MGVKLSYVIEFVADMDRAVKFYRDVIGLVLRKNLCKSKCAWLLVQIPALSGDCSKELLFGILALCEADFPCGHFEAFGSVASAPSLWSSGNCCGMDCSS